MTRRAGVGARPREQRCPGAVQADRWTLSAWTGLLSWPRVDSRWTAPVDNCPGTHRSLIKYIRSKDFRKDFQSLSKSLTAVPSLSLHFSAMPRAAWEGWVHFADNSGTDLKHPHKCRSCAKVLPDDAVVTSRRTRAVLRERAGRGGVVGLVGLVPPPRPHASSR